MSFTPLTALPAAPARTDAPEVFIPKADAFVAALATLRTEFNLNLVEIAAVAALLGVSGADAELSAIAGLTSAIDKGIHFTGSGTAATHDLTSVARTLIAQTTQALMRTTGLGFSANGSSLVSAADYAAMRTLLSLYTSAQVDSAISAAVAAAATVPTGAVQPFAMSSAPTGWLKCDGSSVLRATYANLFTAIGTTYGSVDGTHFTLPDLRGEFVRGWDDARGVDSGRAIGTTQADELESHTHDLKVYTSAGIAHDGSPLDTDHTVHSSSTAISNYIASTGGTETRPRNIALLYCIKT